MVEKIGLAATLDMAGWNSNVAQYNKDISGMTGSTEKTASSMQALGAGLKKAGGDITGVGKNLTMGVTAPIVGIGAAAAKMAGDFEAQMNILTVAARSSGTSLDDLSKAALNVGADTELVGITAAQSADAMTSLYKAGFDTAEIFGGPGGLNSYLNEGASLTGALRSSIDLAAASELDLAQATDATIIAMKTFGLSSEDASRVANSFVRTADASVASVSDLVAAMTNVGPTAAAFGWSLETTNTALGILSSRGIAGSEAGTALKSMMTNLMRPTDDVTGALKSLNVSLYDSEGNLKDLPVILGDLEKALTVTEGAVGGLTEQQRLETVQTLAGTYGMKAMNTLLAEGSAGWANMGTAIGAAASVEESAAARTTGFNAAMEQLGGALETIAIKAGGPIITALTNLLQGPITGLLDKISNLNPAVWDWALKIGLVVAAVGPLLLVLGTLLTTVGSAITVFTALGPVFAAVGGAIAAIGAPVLLVAGAVALLAVAWTRDWGGIRTFMTAFWNNTLKPIVEQIVKWFQDNIPRAISTLSNFWKNTLLPAMQAVGNWITGTLVPILKTVWDWLSTNIPNAINTVSGFWNNTLLPAIRAVWAFINDPLLPLFLSIVDVLDSAMSLALTAVAGLWENVLLPAIKTAGEWIRDNLQPIIEDLTVWFNEKLVPALESAAKWINDNVVPALEDLALIVDGALKTALTWLHDKLIVPLSTALEAIPDIMRKITGWFSTFADKLDALKGKLPDWLTPGSPTPLQIGIEGIAEALTQVIPLIEDMAAALVSVSDSAPTTENLPDWMSGFREMIEQMVAMLGSLYDMPGGAKANAIDLAKRLADELSGVVAIINDAADALTALGTVDFAKLGGETIGDFIYFVHEILFQIKEEAATWGATEEAIKASFALARKLTDQVLDVFRIVATSVEALTAIVDLPETDEATLRKKFRAWEVGMNVGLYYIKRVADFWKDVGLTYAGDFAESSSRVMGIVATAVEAITSVIESKIPSEAVLRAKFGAWEIGVNVAVYYIWRVAKFWQGVALDGAIAFAEAAAKALSIVSVGVEAINNLVEMKPIADMRGKAKRFGENIVALMEELNKALRVLGPESKYFAEPLRGPTPEEIKARFAALAAFSEAVQAGIGFIAPAMDALAGIGGFSPVKRLKESVKAFGEQVVGLMAELSEALRAFSPESRFFAKPLRLPTAEEIKAQFAPLIAFSTVVQEAIGFITPSIESLGAIGGFTPIRRLKEAVAKFGEQVTTLMQELNEALRIFGPESKFFVEPLRLPTAEELRTKFAPLIAFSTAVQEVIGFIVPVIEALQAIAKYTAIKSLKEKVQALLKDLDEAMIKIAELASHWIGMMADGSFSTFWLDMMETFSNSVQAVVAMIVPVIEALSALGKYATANKFAAAITAFKTDLATALRSILSMAVDAKFSPMILELVSGFAQTILSIVGDLKDIIDALSLVAGYKKGTAPAAFVALETDLNSIFITLGRMTFNLEGEMGVERAERFEAAAIAINGAVTRAFEKLGIIGTGGAAGDSTSFADKIAAALNGLKGAATSFQGTWTGAWGAVTHAINLATEALRRFISAAGDVEVPPLVEPGSPPPLAYAFMDIAEAVRQAKKEFATMGGAMRNYALPSTIAAAQTAAAVSNDVTVQMGGVNITNGMDQALFEARVRRIVKEAIRA